MKSFVVNIRIPAADLARFRSEAKRQRLPLSTYLRWRLLQTSGAPKE